MITINLYDYRRVLQQIAIQKQIAAILLAMTLVLVLCGLSWVVEKAFVGLLNDDVREIQTQVSALKPDYDAVQTMKREKVAFNKIITGIDNLRAQRGRTTEILEDIGRSLPEDVWLRGIRQMDMNAIKGKRIPFLFIDYEAKKKAKEDAPDDVFFEIKGSAKYDQSVVQFVELLENIPYFDHVVLLSTNQEWIGLEPIREFLIYSHVVLPEVKE
ncbi:MAG: hypothetical protein E2O44_06225 [Nitrospina sp.]|nr:MAG: hypothetical protein E2O44_06225 [Nitrospina sp.]